MKRLVVIALLLLCGAVNAQDVTKSLGDFSTVRVFDKITVLLVKSNENKIVITGPNTQDIDIVQKKNDLKIKMKFSKMLQGDDISVTLYYKNIDQIEASEGSYVSSEDLFKTTAFELNAKEGAKIKVKLEVEKLKSKLNSGGIIVVSGKASNHDGGITSGGELHAKDLITKQTSISVSAGGNADVYATDFVDAKTTAGGDINVYGSPKQVNKQNTAGGDIDIMKG